MTVSFVLPRGAEAQSNTLDPEVIRRVLDTSDLTDRRGYGLPLDEFARLLYGGSLPAPQVAEAIRHAPGVAIIDGIVVRTDRGEDIPRMHLRRALHGDHAHEATGLGADFAARLVSTCPLVRCVALSGSLSSGGYDPRDDVDFNLVVADGSKYTTYLWAIALSAVTSLRNIRKETDEMGALPFLPKIICVNVIWEEGQVQPFVRTDKWLAYELLMTRPLHGSRYLAGVYQQNPWLAQHFPQLLEPGYLADDDLPTAGVAPRPGHAFFGWLGRHPAALKVVEACSRFIVFGLHAFVSVTRDRNPEAKAREEFVNTVKRPYSVFDVPGSEGPVPSAAFVPR